MGTSPDVLNYYIGKGVVSIKLDGEASFRNIGNVPELELTPVIEKLDHFSSTAGIKTKDRSVATTVGGTLRIILDEITAENLQLALVGALDFDSASDTEIDILSLSELKGAVNFVGANDVGQQLDFSLLSVDFSAGAGVNLISDEWGQIEITGELLSVAGVFGTMTIRDTTSS